MLDRLASGGLITVFLIVFLALGYARVLEAPRRIYLGIAVLTLAVILGSQFLPDGNIFRSRIAGSFGLAGRVLFWISPVIVYAFAVRWIRKKARDPKGE